MFLIPLEGIFDVWTTKLGRHSGSSQTLATARFGGPNIKDAFGVELETLWSTKFWTHELVSMYGIY